MPAEFKNKNYWSVILGGSAGLGLATALKLAKNGMNICIVHRDRRSDLPGIDEHFAEIKKYVNLLSFNMDAVNPGSRNQILLKLKETAGEKSIRALIHSIAKGNLKPMNSADVQVLGNDDFRLTIDAMAVSLYDWTRDMFNHNLFLQDARIVSFTSEGNSKAWKNYAAVSAAKAALEAITRSIALEFASCGIRANCIQAGVTDTNSFRLIPGSKELADYAKMRNPFKRLTRPEDVADAVYLLLLDEASWINGAVIPVNGGEHLS